MGLSRKSAAHGGGTVISIVSVGSVELSEKHADFTRNVEVNFETHSLSKGNTDENTSLQVSYSLDDDMLLRTSQSIHHAHRQSDNESPLTSRAILFGDFTAGLPSPMMNLMGSRQTGGSVSAASQARGIRMLLSLHRDRTPSPSTQRAPSRRLSSCSYTDDAGDGNEMLGDMVTEPPCSQVFAADGADEKHEEEGDDNSLIVSSDCVGTTTGASVGRLTNPIRSQSTQSIGLFGRQRYSQVGGGLFDSMETTTTWDIAPPLDAVHPPTHAAHHVVLSDSCYPMNMDN